MMEEPLIHMQFHISFKLPKDLDEFLKHKYQYNL